MNLIPVKEIWDIGKDIATGAKKFRDRRRQHREEARARIVTDAQQAVLTPEECFEKELEVLEAQLKSAQTDDDRSHYRDRIIKKREEQELFYTAKRSVTIPPQIRQRMDELETAPGVAGYAPSSSEQVRP